MDPVSGIGKRRAGAMSLGLFCGAGEFSSGAIDRIGIVAERFANVLRLLNLAGFAVGMATKVEHCDARCRNFGPAC